MGKLPGKTQHTSQNYTTIALFLALVLVGSACGTAKDQLETSAVKAAATSSNTWYTIYFTDPSSPIAESYRGGPDEGLAKAIEAARLSLDMAIYDLNLWSVRDALISAHRRGVLVRVVTESDNMDELEIQELKEAGIDVLGDRHEGLMHDKFVVIDGMEVWTGSMNFTTGGGYLDNNNLLRIQSPELAKDYTHEFEQMFVDDHFGSEKTLATPNPNVTIDGSLVESYFSPEDGTLQRLLAAVDGAQESICFLAYSFTVDELSQAMIERAAAGVKVMGVFDKDQYHSNQGTEFDRLKNAGLDIRLDGNPRLMHHKVIIIDGKVVVTGSYNFSYNAEQNNDENTLIIHNQEFAGEYLAEFQRIYLQAQR
jgi:phosphatidylserine/phosphatidylglycerophosphate/cardiolipin synthase-like enzyme